MQMETKLNLTLNGNTRLNLALSGKDRLSVDSIVPIGTTVAKDYNQLANRPEINGRTLEGDSTAYDLRIVSENSSAGWAESSGYVPKRGEIVIFREPDGVVNIKIGDGAVPVVDLPFVGKADTDAISKALQNHISDTTKHVTQAERDFWNQKLNYEIIDNELVFTRN